MKTAAATRGLHDRSATKGQRGATLIISLIMLVLITLMVFSAFSLSSSNLKTVGNVQVHEEAVASANGAIELVLSSAFADAPVAQSVNVDINKDGTTDYVVAIDVPTCVRALAGAAAGPSDVELPTSLSTGSTWNTEWNITATVTDAASGAVVTVVQGVRVLQSAAQKEAVCA
jgi:Tfp pilus assembly protein PilX